MTNDQINTAIARKLGFTVIEAPFTPVLINCHDPKIVFTKEARREWYKTYKSGARLVPDYCSDLNLCHEAEKELDEGHVIIGFMQHLGVIAATNGIIWKAVHATAQQRALALCKTWGLEV